MTNPIKTIETSDTLTLASVVCVFFITLTYVLSIYHDNYSWVDRLWTILPWLHGWIMISRNITPRSFLLMIIPTLWGLRMSYNYYRKGGYFRGE